MGGCFWLREDIWRVEAALLFSYSLVNNYTVSPKLAQDDLWSCFLLLYISRKERKGTCSNPKATSRGRLDTSRFSPLAWPPVLLYPFQCSRTQSLKC